jgi:hypothetical protein
MSAKEGSVYRQQKALKRTAARVQREDVDRRAHVAALDRTTAKRLPTPGGGALAVKVCAVPTCYGVVMARPSDPLPPCPKCGSERMGEGPGQEGTAEAEDVAGTAKGAGGR